MSKHPDVFEVTLDEAEREQFPASTCAPPEPSVARQFQRDYEDVRKAAGAHRSVVGRIGAETLAALRSIATYGPGVDAATRRALDMYIITVDEAQISGCCPPPPPDYVEDLDAWHRLTPDGMFAEAWRWIATGTVLRRDPP